MGLRAQPAGLSALTIARADNLKGGSTPECGGSTMLETKPRYVVELTLEGWQIKDSQDPAFGRASAFGSKQAAETEAEAWNLLEEESYASA